MIINSRNKLSEKLFINFDIFIKDNNSRQFLLFYNVSCQCNMHL